ncbi:hypothetical protein ABMA28_003475 [Loxostege sticticalis]|uniref:PiggyBac transposable element-derived protein domain-containing protein n=1 Tax=Loxostege sticticalis TaxID=481309 RepID=A0ABD0SW87_LOXSC
MLMTRNRRLTIEKHWSTNPFLNSSIYKTLMSRNRYTMLLGMLHFSRPGTRQPDDLIISKINYYFTHRITHMENWYSSPKLFNFLASRGIGACGTVKKTRKEKSKFRTSLKKGQRDVKLTSRIMAVKWHDKKDVTKYFRVTALRCIRKVTKWYKKHFFHIIDLHLLNSFHYLKVLREDKKSRFEKYQLSVITQIVLKYCRDRTLPVTARVKDQPTRLLGNIAQHMLTLIPNS